MNKNSNNNPDPDLIDFENCQDDNLNLNNTVEELTNRIEQLEILNDTTQINLNVLQQILDIMSEFPAGKQIINRAINRYRLSKLTDEILPRRQETLDNLKGDTSIPDTIKNSFIKKELSLIKTTFNAIKKRQRFEQKAAKNVKIIFNKLNIFFNRHKKLSPVMMIGKD
jgi:septal ring factor EnvC (AmiA/AmiB activator)